MSFEIQPLTPHIGAEVRGLDLTLPIDAADADRLREAFRKHLLLVVRQHGVSGEDQIRFGNLFGTVILRTKYSVPTDAPLTQWVSNSRQDGILGDVEIEFHQDHFYYDEPLKAIILYGIEIPRSGSATEFRNAIALLDSLPPALKARAEGVRALQDGDYTPWKVEGTRKPGSPQAWHPLFYTDPDSGRRAVCVTLMTTVDFEGIGRDEGHALIREIWDHAAAQTQFNYVHHWQPGDLLIWDNRMVQHARLPFDASEPRTLRRTQIL